MNWTLIARIIVMQTPWCRSTSRRMPRGCLTCWVPGRLWLTGRTFGCRRPRWEVRTLWSGLWISSYIKKASQVKGLKTNLQIASFCWWFRWMAGCLNIRTFWCTALEDSNSSFHRYHFYPVTFCFDFFFLKICKFVLQQWTDRQIGGELSTRIQVWCLSFVGWIISVILIT